MVNFFVFMVSPFDLLCLEGVLIRVSYIMYREGCMEIRGAGSGQSLQNSRSILRLVSIIW